MSVREGVQADDHQDDGGCRRHHRDRYCSLVTALRPFSRVPYVKECDTPDDEHRKRQGTEKYPQGPQPFRIPVDDPLGKIHRLVLQRLKGAFGERSHEENSRKDKQYLHGGDSAVDGFHIMIDTTKYTA